MGWKKTGKMIKRTASVLVLCLAAYGTYMLLKKPPQRDVTPEDAAYLKKEFGMDVQEGQASEQGVAPVFYVEGVSPPGVPLAENRADALLGNPPVFDTAPPIVAPPAFFETVPSAPAPPNSPMSVTPAPSEPQPDVAARVQPEVPVAVPVAKPAAVPVAPPPEAAPPPAPPADPQPVASKPVEPVLVLLPAPSKPQAQLKVLPAPGLSTAPLLRPPVEPVAVSPPQETQDSRIAPASLSSDLPQALPHFAAPRTINPLAAAPETAHIPADSFDSIAYHPVAETVRPLPADTETKRTTDNYVRTATRQRIIFEPAKPELDGKAPIVSFAPPKIHSHVAEVLSLSPVQAAAGTPPEEKKQPAVKHQETPAAGKPVLVRAAVARFIEEQYALTAAGNAKQTCSAFIDLSLLYEQKELNDAEREKMLPILDHLARSVIYARETHILEPPYTIQQGDTIESVAGNFKLTPSLLCKINGLTPGQPLRAGGRLKVLTGQFDAKISIRRSELILSLGGLYAGRFPIQINKPAADGEYFVTNISADSVTLTNGWILSVGSSKNPAVVFAEQDAEELLNILSALSVFVIEN